jgi:Uma2 family endonuclease
MVTQAQRTGMIDDKVKRYLDDGVQAVWVVNPRHASGTRFTRGDRTLTRLTAQDTLDEASLLPGFSITVRALFTA